MTKLELNCSSFVTSWYNFSPPMGAVSLSKFYFSLRNKNRKKRIPKKKKGVLVHGSLVDGRRRKSKSGLLLLPSHFLCFSSLPSDRGNKIYWANKGIEAGGTAIKATPVAPFSILKRKFSELIFGSVVAF